MKKIKMELNRIILPLKISKISIFQGKLSISQTLSLISQEKQIMKKLKHLKYSLLLNQSILYSLVLMYLHQHFLSTKLKYSLLPNQPILFKLVLMYLYQNFLSTKARLLLPSSQRLVR